MSQANQWVGWGNLTRDPEIRYFEDEIRLEVNILSNDQKIES